MTFLVYTVHHEDTPVVYVIHTEITYTLEIAHKYYRHHLPTEIFPEI